MSYLFKRELAFSSVLAKKRLIEDETNKIKAEREHGEKLVSDISLVLDAQQLRLSEVASELEAFSVYLPELEKGYLEYTTKIVELFRFADSVLDGFLSTTKVLSEKIEQQEIAVKELEAKKIIVHEGIVEEQAKLSAKERDLQIYRDRLDKKVAELGLDIKIKL